MCRNAHLRGLRGLASVLGLASTLAACGGGPSRGGSRAGPAPRDHARSAPARWAALALSHRGMRRLLGGQRFEGVHAVASTLDGKPERAYTDTYRLACRAGGDCQGRLDNSLEYGLEFVRQGERTWFRHRYQEFLGFTEDREESERRVEHLWGIGGAVLALLRPQVRLVPAGKAALGKRPVARYRLERLPRPRPSPAAAGHGPGPGPKAWRTRATVELAEGEVWLDAATGAPVRWTIRYRVSAPKGTHRVTLAGTLRAEVKAPGTDPEITPPARFAEATSRQREVLDERALLGNHRLNPGWFRGGGPHAARERRRAGARERRRAGARPAPGRASPARPRAPSAARPHPSGGPRPARPAAPVPSARRRAP